MSRGHYLAKAGVVLLVALAVWWGLDRIGPRADWLRVEAPRRAVAGESLPLRVRLAPLPQPAFLCADLHWAFSRDTTQGYLATGGIQAAGAEGGSFDFAVPVPPLNGLRFVRGVIYLSPTGNWHDRTLAAITELIPVSAARVPRLAAPLSPLRVESLDEHPEALLRPAAWPRWLTAVFFLLATVRTWATGRSDAERERWRVLAVALVLAGLWELFGLENVLGDVARHWARAGDFYHARAGFQKIVVSAVVAVMVFFLVRPGSVRREHRFGLAIFGLYLGIAAVNLLSLHVIDLIADLSWHGLTLVQTLKLGCAAMTLHALSRAFTPGRSSTTGPASAPSPPR